MVGVCGRHLVLVVVDCAVVVEVVAEVVAELVEEAGLDEGHRSGLDTCFALFMLNLMVSAR